jgi:hypothetical protein
VWGVMCVRCMHVLCGWCMWCVWVCVCVCVLECLLWDIDPIVMCQLPICYTQKNTKILPFSRAYFSEMLKVLCTTKTSYHNLNLLAQGPWATNLFSLYLTLLQNKPVCFTLPNLVSLGCTILPVKNTLAY